jgi:DnaJ-class molecular chaperone
MQLRQARPRARRLTLAGKGDEAPDRGAGDVVLVVRQALHARFERRGDDLHARVEVRVPMRWAWSACEGKCCPCTLP